MNDTTDTATDPAPNTGAGSRVVKRHGWATRVWHWVNALCLLVLFMSGLQIFNAHPELSWGAVSDFNDPIFQITAKRLPSGKPVGITQIGEYTFYTTGYLGLFKRDGQLVVRAFPSWITLPGPQWLSMGRHWHLTLAWVFGPMLFAYIAFTLISTRRRRLVVPSRDEWRALPGALIDHLLLRFSHGPDYNSLQKLGYLTVIFGLLPLMVLTGLTMSPTVVSNWPWLLDLFGGRQSARTLHFIGMVLLLAFFFIHIAMVLLSGVFNNMRAMTTGGFKLKQRAPAEETDAEGRHE